MPTGATPPTGLGDRATAGVGAAEVGPGSGDCDGSAGGGVGLDDAGPGVGDLEGCGAAERERRALGVGEGDRLGVDEAEGSGFPRGFPVPVLAMPVTIPVAEPKIAPTRITVPRIGPERDAVEGGCPSPDTRTPYPVVTESSPSLASVD